MPRLLSLSAKQAEGQMYIREYNVVKEFQDIFPAELTSIPLPQEVEFTVDLIPRKELVSRTPYRMASTELREIKE
jgi:hypothetical protein